MSQETDIQAAGHSSPIETILMRVVSVLEKCNPAVQVLFYIGGVVGFFFVCFVFLDVVLRYFLDRPLPFSVDICSMALELILFFGLAYVQVQKRHLAIDLIISRMRSNTALALSTAMYIVCLAIVVLIIWQGVSNTLYYYHTGKLSCSGMLLFPSAAIIPVGCFFLFIVLLRDIVTNIIKGLQVSFGPGLWLLTLVAPVLWIVFTISCLVLPETNVVVVSGLSILLLLLFVFLGMPIGFVLLMIGFMLMGYTNGLQGVFMGAGSMVYSQTTNYSFVVIPLFVIMAYFIVHARIGADAYFGVYKWVGHFRGGLAYATVGAATGLAAVTGDGVATTVTMGTIAYPEMRRYRYADSLATGTIAAGASLGPIIPPSIPFIVFGVLAEESIGKLFIAGIVPGIILALSFIGIIFISCRIKPELGPSGERSDWRERIRALPIFAPILALFLVILGGIYGGIFSAVEGGGIGAFMSLMIALAMKRLNWQKFKDAIVDSISFTSMLLLIIAGGLILGNGMGSIGLANALSDAALRFGITPMVFLIIVLFVYLIWGIISESIIVVLITVPILAPVAKAMGIDLVWFGVLITVTANVGFLTPPYAMGIFVLKSVAPGNVSISSMYRGIIPFCISTFVVIALILLFPSIATWLPYLMMR